MKRKVIIDCDPGIDDSLAIMLALSSPEIEVAGITIVCGNAPVEMGAGNARKVLQFMNRLDVPVYVGAEKPLRRAYINALDTHGADGLGESFLPEVEGYRTDMDAVTFLRQSLMGETCSVIALGPLTNLANLYKEAPDAFARIEELVSMGGNYKSHGNCSPVAEYNYWADPDAADIVYDAFARQHKKIHMVGLDVTRQIVLTPDLLEYMYRLDAACGAFVKKITKFYLDFHWEWEHLIGCVINDPLAVAYFLNRELCRGFEAYVDIETDGISIGQTVVDAYDFYKKEANAIVLTEVEVKEFFYLFFARLLHMKKEDLDLIEQIVK
ncbi:MAG: nucleoside hydrolase [Lachnospiraceae bacterium]|nr:nucleoside hydrolase [Lachnospiraceae bacterium]